MSDEIGGIADELIPETGVALSLRDQLRQRREEQRKRSTLDLIIPGYGGDLAVRYRSLPEDAIKKFADKISKGEDGLGAARQMVVLACEAVLVREDGELEPLTDETDSPIRFDERLAEFLAIDADRAVDVAQEVFSPGGTQPLAVMAHASALSNWMTGKDLEVDEELLGE